MSAWIVFLLILLVLVTLSVATTRNRRCNVAAEQDRAARIAVGTDVMTTSGLYGTVVARNDDDTALLSIAPGVEVRWAIAALRDVADLPEQYRPAAEAGDAEPDELVEPAEPTESAEQRATDDDAR